MNIPRIARSLAFISLFARPSHAATSWEVLFHPPVGSGVSAMCAAPDGGVLVASDALLIRFDASGVPVWTQTFADRLGVGGATFTANGDIALVGSLDIGGRGTGWMARLRGDGIVLWERTMQSFGLTFTSALAPAQNGDVFVVGTYRRNTWMAGDAWLMRVDPAGSVVWQEAVGTLGAEEESIAVFATPDGGAVAAASGHTIGISPATWLIKFTGSGRVDWQQDVALDGRRVVETADGSIAVAGNRTYPVIDAANLVYDVHGKNLALRWGRSVPSLPVAPAYELVDVKPTRDGGLVTVGHRYDPYSGSPQIWAVRWSATGDLLWERVFGGTEEDQAAGIDQTADGGFVIGGRRLTFPQLTIWVLKTDENGDVPSSCGRLDRPPAVVTSTSADLDRTTLAPFTTTIAPQNLADTTSPSTIQIFGSCPQP